MSRSSQGNRIEELDFESAEHKQLKGNIYLAKVTRVEPSLAGGVRRLWRQPPRLPRLLRKSIPDYYQIPSAKTAKRLLA